MADERDVVLADLARTGIPGLDDILEGGLTRRRMYLVEGDPGAGKTTLALQFLMEGRRLGETVLYVSFAETEEECRDIAASHGWELAGIDLLELVASDDILDEDGEITLFHPSEVELNRTTRQILSRAETTCPTRVVIDSLSEVRLLAESPLRYRRQVLALKQFFSDRNCTLLLLDDRPAAKLGSAHLQSVAHGVVALEQFTPDYGGERRRLRVQKMRGRGYRNGYHDFAIRRGGLEVFPRLVASEHHTAYERTPLASGIANLDAMLCGGISPGTSLLLQGPAGCGKSSVAVQYAVAAAGRGQHAAIFTFDEGKGTLLTRSEGLGMGLAALLESGAVDLRQIDPAELTPGQFSQAVRTQVEERGAKVVVIDTLNGYQHAMVNERFLLTHLHELLSYTAQQGVLTVLVMVQQGGVGPNLINAVDTSYLADSVIQFRYLEVGSELRQSLSVIKKRDGNHERTLRELSFGPDGIAVGQRFESPVDAACGPLRGGRPGGNG